MARGGIQVVVDVLRLIIALQKLLRLLPLLRLPRLSQRVMRLMVRPIIRTLRPDRNHLPWLLRTKCNVKIVGLRILRYGDETRTANPFVTHVVSNRGMLDLIIVGLYHKLHGEHRPIQMKKTVIKRRKRIVPTNYISGATTPHSHYGRRPSMSSNSPSPPPSHSHHSHSPRSNYGPLPPLWGGHPGRTSQSYSPEPQDFTNYRFNPVAAAISPKFPPSYSEQNTLPPIRLPLGHAHPQSLSPPPLVPSIQHVGNAIPLPKRPHDSPESAAKRLRPIGALLHPTPPVDIDPLEGARALLTLGSRESVIRKRAELMGEIDVLGEKLDNLKRAVAECDEFLGKA